MKILVSIIAATALTFAFVCFPHISIAASPVPQPSVGDYFRDNASGFIVERKERGAPEIVRYGMGFTITKKIVTPLYVRTRFENPTDPSHPLIVDSVLRPGATSFALDSPPVNGLKVGGKYKIEVLVFDSPKRIREISRHVTHAQFF